MSSKETKTKKPRKSVGKKGKRQTPANDLTNVDRTFFELTINDLNNKLSRLKSQLIASEEKIYSLSTKLKDFEEARDDITCHMRRILIQRDELIAEHEKTIENLKETCQRKNTASSVKIHDLELKYKDMKSQLASEIKLLKGQLSSLNEFQRLRDSLYERYDDLRAAEKKRVDEHEEQLFELQQKTVVERDSLRKEIEIKLIQVAQDFTLSNEIRNAGYTQRLIRENVALQKETEQLMETLKKTQQKLRENMERNKKVHEEYTILKKTQQQLMQGGQNKIVIIEKLTSNYEHLKEKYVEVLRYRKLYEQLTKKNNCSSHYVRDMTIKLRHLGQTIESLKLNNTRLQATVKQNESEIDKLRTTIQQIRNAIEVVIADVKDEHSCKKSDDTGDRKIRRLNLLSHLLNIIARHSNTVPQTTSLTTLSYTQSSIYHKGNMGLIPTQRVSLMEIFKRGSRVKASATESDGLTFDILSSESKIIPKERANEAASILDVEWGSSLYYTSSHEDLELLQVDDDREDIATGDDSSSSFESARIGANNKRVSSVETKPLSDNRQNSEIVEMGKITMDINTSINSTSSLEEEQWQSYSDEEEFSIELFY